MCLYVQTRVFVRCKTFVCHNMETCSRKNRIEMLEAGERSAYKTEQNRYRKIPKYDSNAAQCRTLSLFRVSPSLAKADYNHDKNAESAPSETTLALSDVLSKVFPIYVLQPTPRGIIYCYVQLFFLPAIATRIKMYGFRFDTLSRQNNDG